MSPDRITGQAALAAMHIDAQCDAVGDIIPWDHADDRGYATCPDCGQVVRTVEAEETVTHRSDRWITRHRTAD